MTYDDFSSKLQELKREFLKSRGRKMETLKELEEYVVRRKVGIRKSGKLKSLKGLSI